ncbi:MAG: Gfo/Idh/MocA family oxidoreductase, partial [Candidatus Limnocylindria bacterium]
MSGDALRAAVIGLGMMGANHARVLNELPGVDLVGVADLDPAAVQRATSGRTARGYISVEDMLGAER